MGYPYGDTYLKQIQKNKNECREIRDAYFVLLNKYCKDNHCDDIELDLRQMFAILAEAFELESWTLNGVTDVYHFMGDVVEELLPEHLNESCDK